MKFILQPFSTAQLLPDIQIIGNITRNDNKLNLDYTLKGNLAEVDIISPSDTPTRKDDLWQDTCFEFFLGIKDSSGYWEFNLSPSGDWNVYRFTGYRQGIVEETAFTEFPFIVERRLDSLVVSLNVDLAKIVLPEAGVEVAITTVIKDKNSEVSYWALTHRGGVADFHLRDSFVLEL
ncbi:DOMON-like domain-containing protein [Limnofasciculus baicalensis]|uniref:DOMON-like domain-containing protein n=1 Tax=Limnofasciculus baicalensis BBK-W-15 TaxID=2699891 RepID=A0AAE3KQZ1_9CYAN|nr:DOMON-like domain-containing protein [Limnofasciculus baicalensis]MCP2727877.1 DOMON-like domain-containing protein [Limnofasciculus baicalensis BBK-W-15]